MKSSFFGKQRVSYEQFTNDKRIGEIDGLRAVAILFVLAGHMHDPMWGNLPGTGVPIFFVNSGFLITLLLVREIKKRGKVDWEAFYVRRVFRLLPVYFFAVILFSALVLAGLAENSGDWGRRLVYFLTFQNEFVPGATFGHTWTLAVQEKFYIVWPLLAFAVLSPIFAKRRFWFAVALTAVLTTAWFVWPANYTVMFIPLLLGCVLAFLMSELKSFNIVSILARPAIFLPILAIAIFVKTIDDAPGKLSVPFSFLVFLLMPGLIIGASWISRGLKSKALVFVGLRAYSIYLLHPLVLSAVDLVIKPGQSSLVLEIARYIAVIVGSVGFATVTYKFIEKPSMDFGRRFSDRRVAKRSIRTEKASETIGKP